ncbi:protein S40-5-like [Gastrolobium bilobum]|uniref:protein S40-5-like n=1 Tax=Gastrolobium bilobum TaxID=150636 RepID=UPI002AB109B5|nr:protein S40-5-like [Gastrolobium bilobum]
MAKGRKLTTSRSERFLGTYAYSHSQVSAVADPSDLREEDVWSTADETRDRDSDFSNGEWEPHAAADSNGGSSVRSRRRIPLDREDHRHVGGLSLAFEDPASNAVTASSSSSRIVHQFRAHERVASSPRGRHVASSAPVNVPDWSKILRVDSVESLHDADDGFDENESEMVPPHEYLARSRRMEANSVFEGVGRTLKGRDLSRVRDAVWSQTGFYG